MKEEELTAVEMTVDRLVSGDRPSLYYFGMVGAHAIRKDEVAVFMVDAAGRICLMPPTSVKILEKPRISDDDLNKLSEEHAIQLLLKQGDSEEEVLDYLVRRPQS